MFARIAAAALLMSLTATTFGQLPTGPSLTPPVNDEAAKPAEKVTSGSPEFDKLLTQWDELRDQMYQAQVDYKLAKPADRAPLEEKFAKLKAEGEKLRPELLKAAEAGLKANPKGTAFLTFLASTATGLFNADRYDEALAIADKLIAADYENKRIYNLAGKAAFDLNDFEKAEKYLKIAEQNSALDGVAEDYLKLIPAYKPLWKKEQELRTAEEKVAGDAAKALPRVLIKTNEGDIVVELFENEAPQTVGNFINLVEKGFYNGTTFHRVIREFMAQGGDPKGDGTGGPGYEILDEADKPNHRLHFRGALSMAHSNRKNSGGSQFFLTFRPTPHLDGKSIDAENQGLPHTVFGRVVDGFDVLAKLNRRDRPFAAHGEKPGPLPPADKIIEAKVLRKRNHAYEPTKVEAPKANPATP